jgi:hypothetical protein
MNVKPSLGNAIGKGSAAFAVASAIASLSQAGGSAKPTFSG